MVAKPIQWNSSTRQNHSPSDPPLYIAVTFESIMLFWSKDILELNKVTLLTADRPPSNSNVIQKADLPQQKCMSKSVLIKIQNKETKFLKSSGSFFYDPFAPCTSSPPPLLLPHIILVFKYCDFGIFWYMCYYPHMSRGAVVF